MTACWGGDPGDIGRYGSPDHAVSPEGGPAGAWQMNSSHAPSRYGQSGEHMATSAVAPWRHGRSGWGLPRDNIRGHHRIGIDEVVAADKLEHKHEGVTQISPAVTIGKFTVRREASPSRSMRQQSGWAPCQPAAHWSRSSWLALVTTLGRCRRPARAVPWLSGRAWMPSRRSWAVRSFCLIRRAARRPA